MPHSCVTSISVVWVCLPVGSGDIVEGNLKLILGLIWTLILHYQISIGFGLNDQPKGGPTPKQALLDYINVST